MSQQDIESGAIRLPSDAEYPQQDIESGGAVEHSPRGFRNNFFGCFNPFDVCEYYLHCDFVGGEGCYMKAKRNIAGQRPGTRSSKESEMLIRYDVQQV
jgi:hypothetical protein